MYVDVITMRSLIDLRTDNDKLRLNIDQIQCSVYDPSKFYYQFYLSCKNIIMFIFT